MGWLRMAALIGAAGLGAVACTTNPAFAKPPTFTSATPPTFASERFCLAEAIYFEARGESAPGQMAVGQVIINRAKNPAYPRTICDVVNQNAHRVNRCQFSYRCDGKVDRITEWAPWQQILQRSAFLLLCGGGDCLSPDLPRGLLAQSTHYHATSVTPSWSRKLKRTGQIGRHIFYQGS
ncbi:MAG: cell wall hydrolase [Aestuariivirgaceae bacterium]